MMVFDWSTRNKKSAEGQRRPFGHLLNISIYCCVVVGILLYQSSNVSVTVAASYSCISALVCTTIAFANKDGGRSWLFWFTFIYFVFFQLGTVIAAVLLVYDDTLLNYATNFSNYLSTDSIAKSYIASGLCIALIWTLSALFYRKRVGAVTNLGFDLNLYKVAYFLLVFTFPPVLVDLVDQFRLVSSYGYSFFYTSSFQDRESIVPAMGIIRTLNTLGFYMFFAAMPDRRRFSWGAGFFLLVAVLDSMKGARSALIVPLCFITWHAITYYGLKVRIGRGAVLLSLALGFLIFMSIARSDSGSDTFMLTRFFTIGLSKAQYTLAVVLENYNHIEVKSIFALEPVIFPIKYMLYGGDLVGQSESTAILRQDLNHTFSSQLNFGAYLSGAGIGSNFVAEALQFGPVYMPVFLTIWWVSIRFFFKYSKNYRTIFFIQPIVFIHLISSPRASIFPSTWPIIKLLSLFLVVKVIIWFLSKLPKHNRLFG
ncbi:MULTISPECIES: O-antigen polysaccharide polymerase Wzy [Kordiimonas]|jgi:hypothetical protein|uniref:O-antigen polysaccharide polymerase Wzy n=1 Tax=Kordiimonas TaxID=288021 RepID=UPI00258113EF|nr:O-antigen polysaccharide polymerase Wzy [Kordiimonas sp. UBA4487]